MKLRINPSARINRRYLLVVGGRREEIEKIIFDYLGVLGWARASPLFIEGGKKEGKVVISVERKEVDDVKAAFELSGKNIKIVKCSGTLKSLEK